jgi:hypothetical protein
MQINWQRDVLAEAYKLKVQMFGKKQSESSWQSGRCRHPFEYGRAGALKALKAGWIVPRWANKTTGA